MATIDEMLGAEPPTAESIANFLKAHQFPLVEGRQVTFVYEGAADEVNLRHFIFGLPSVQPFLRVKGSDLWHLTMEIPERSRVEYKIERVKDDQHEWLMDPLNPHIARDPYGANSVCHGEGYVPPEWVVEDPEARRGTVERVRINSGGIANDGHLHVYLPARFRKSRRYPLLIVHDGSDFMRFSSFTTVLDNLIHRLEIAPMIVAMLDSSDRLREYGALATHAEFLSQRLVPALEDRYPLVRKPHARALLGASFGAVAALHAAHHAPGYFGRLMLQSGSFAFSDIGDHERGPLFDSVAGFVNSLREEPSAFSEKIFLTCGTYESLIYENRSIYPLLMRTGMDVRFVESRDGHNWENWRDRLREGLSWLYPGPLWMVYE